MAAKTIPTVFNGFFGPTFVYSRENDVNRWHNVPVLKSETVAAHTFDVLKKAMVIRKLLYLSGFNVDDVVVYEMVMVHDIEERTRGTGDIPGDFKEKMAPAVKQGLKK